MEYERHYDRCMLMFRGVNSETFDHWVLGDAFLRPFYQVYDAENYRIGLVTNLLTLGEKHEDLISIGVSTEMNFTWIIIVFFIITV